ncbi:YlbL family protein [Arthrobacter ulcerisalmonis]
MIAGLTALGLGIAVATIPVPYVVESPGPTYNTLGESQGHPVIKVSGHETYPAAGNLDLTTVYVDGGPNGPVSILGAFSSWLDRTKSVYPEELIYPTGTSREEAQEQSSVAMTTSQENAIASALNELKIPYGQKLQAVDLSPGAAAEGRIEPDDVLVSINGTPITSLAVIQADLAAGNGAPVEVVVERDGQQLTQTMTPKDNGEGRFILGVVLKALFTFPFDVQISLDKVGGPSAGMMFALGIIDTVTPGDLTGVCTLPAQAPSPPTARWAPSAGSGRKWWARKRQVPRCSWRLRRIATKSWVMSRTACKWSRWKTSLVHELRWNSPAAGRTRPRCPPAPTTRLGASVLDRN